jgi:hypothetical protein
MFIAVLRRRIQTLSPGLHHWASTLDNAHQYYDYGDYQQDMNKSTQGVGADHSQQPKDQ